MIDGVTVVPHLEDWRINQLPKRAKSLGRREISQSVLCQRRGPQAGRNCVDIFLAQQVNSTAAHVGHFDLCVLEELLLRRKVPLPGIHQIAGCRKRAVRGTTTGAYTRRYGIQRTCSGATGYEAIERRVSSAKIIVVEAVALEELPDAAAQHRFLLAGDVPGEAQARRDGVVVLVDQCVIAEYLAAHETCSLAGIRIVFGQKNPIAGVIDRNQAGIESRRVKD